MKNICVYCGSSPGSKPEYSIAAQALGVALVERNIGLVYGGATLGIMGTVADAVLNAGGNVIGVIPEVLAVKEVVHTKLSELIVVDSMHQRKAVMAERADGFIALPGGLGTLEELFEILTWTQLGLHHKPCALLNICGYYDALCDFLDNAQQEKFIKPIHRSLLLQHNEPVALLQQMQNYQAPHIKQTISQQQS